MTALIAITREGPRRVQGARVERVSAPGIYPTVRGAQKVARPCETGAHCGYRDPLVYPSVKPGTANPKKLAGLAIFSTLHLRILHLTACTRLKKAGFQANWTDDKVLSLIHI